MARHERSLNQLRTEGKKQRCPECSGELVYEDSEIRCLKCGLVVEL